MASKNSKKSAATSTPKRKSQQQKTSVNLNPSQNNGMTVVGIGASAGGLKALQTFFEALPSDTGMAYVVVTHLHPEHESHLAEILQLRTHMPVTQVAGPVAVEADHVYVIPPNRRILMTDSKLDVAGFEEPRGQRAPIDQFFRSLAHAHPNAVGIICSGGGTDGAVGIKAIKEEGGLLMVQHPDEAEYDSMPRAAIATGLADVVLPVHELAGKLLEFIRQRPQLPSDADELTEQQFETIRRILAHVHARTGHDFSQYKRSTVLRRIQRRMRLHGLLTLETYLAYLRNNAPEATAMFNDILIGVTSFFRDRESWQYLEEHVIPALFRDKEITDTVRAWTIGCATGEEAYSIAMLLFEYGDKLELRPQLQIFASDLDENAIRQAREGLYPAVIEADVSPERLARFFIAEGNHYRVRRELRDAVLFTSHSVLRDAPFSRLDLISCRNLLIYLEREVQENVFDIFHYALKPGGYLFLGNSESAESIELFQTVDKTHHIYRAKPWNREHPHVPTLPLSIGSSTYHERYTPPRAPRTHLTQDIPLLNDDHHAALELHAPPSILINEMYAVLHVSETAGRYLVQPQGPITTDLLKLVRPELQFELRAGLFRAFEKNQPVITQPVAVQFNGHARRLIMSVQPRTEIFQDESRHEKQALVMFLEYEPDEPFAAAPMSEDSRDNILIMRLEAEVRRLREQLQASIEQYESSSEELKASNEELQSINEEYRSATEELQTVNNELKTKLEEISRAHNDLENLMGATEIAMLFLDRSLRILHYTPDMQKLFNIMPSDRGRPIKHLTHTLQYNHFLDDAEQVLRSLIPIEREVRGEKGEWFLLRMRPYLSTDNHVEGLIFTFIDITQLKYAEEQLVEINSSLEQRVQARTSELEEANRQSIQARDLFYTLFYSNPIPTSLSRLENDELINVNDAYLEFSGFQSEQLIGHVAQEFGLPLPQDIRPQIVARLQSEGMIRNLELEVRRASDETAIVLASVQLVTIDQSQAVLLSFIDISDRVRSEQQIRSLAYDLTMAEQEERQRISQILHDDLQQRIFAVKMQVANLAEGYRKNQLQSAEVDFAQLQEWLDESISITRNLSIDLSPAILRGDGLTDALIWLASQMEDQYGLHVDIHSNGIAARYEDTLRILLFQAVREILFNVVKHANTREATIDIERVDHHTRLTIKDGGMGFDAKEILKVSKKSGGLLNLQHRLDLMGCKMQVKSKPNVQGTQVIIEIPTDK